MSIFHQWPTPTISANLLINPKAWPNLKVNDLIEITMQTVNNSAAGGPLNTAAAAGGSTNTIALNASVANNLANMSHQQLSNSMNRASQFQQQSTVTTNAAAAAATTTAPANQQQQQQLQQDEDASPFLVQVVQSSFSDTIPVDTIRLDAAASAAPFAIKPFAYVTAAVVDKHTVGLDLVELLFITQYVTGNDMLRIKKHLENTCVYVKKSIEYCGMRCSVREMWAPSGDIVTCGYVSEKTRLAFRSQSAMCTIYIQMSREMWEFDVNGEMYHEKAINFLGELFANWKNLACQHDVTIALFSRVFYSAASLDEFPASLSAHIKRDHKQRFYEDFYRVIYQNERYEDWMPSLVILKRLIKEYRDYILNYHQRQLLELGTGERVPECFLSSAPEGNFLETLNLSSSVFERHFIDRPFDRTGMMSLIITPGNGVFEASYELTKITKERVIDNGIGSDLVCLGEQPLHSVPLLKYDTVEPTYGIPHWINLSFYKSSETVRYCNSRFLPTSKIKVRPHANNTLSKLTSKLNSLMLK